MGISCRYKNYYFPYYGGKHYYWKYITPLFENCDTFFDAFCGGGHVFAHYNNYKKLWINDKNKLIIALYKEIAENPQFKELCELSYLNLVEKTKVKKEYIKNINKSFLCGKFSKNQLAQCYALILCMRGGLKFNKCGLETGGFARGEKGKKYGFSWPKVELVSKLQNAIISAWDYSYILEKAGKSDVVYLDPPYMASDEHDKKSLWGGYFYKEINWRDFVKNCNSAAKRTRIVISGNDAMAELFPKWNIIKIPVCYAGRKIKRTTNETIIFNFKKHGQLDLL